jgi:DNA cross-link repair 1A protein
MLTEDPLEAAVHIVPLSLINPERLKLYANRWKEKFDKVVGFRPTGWT